MKIIKSLAAVLAGSLIAAGAQAGSVLYFADYTLGSNAMGAALATTTHTVTTASSYADFSNKVGAGGWDLVIYFQQNSSDAGAMASLSSWVSGGGKSIFTDWTRNASLGNLFGASYGSTNQNSMTITNGSLDDGLSNPVSLSNPGWGTYSMSLTATTGTSAAKFGNGSDAIVIGNGGDTILNGFLSDTLGLANGKTLFINEVNYLLGARTDVPEPASLALVGLALAGLAAARRKQR